MSEVESPEGAERASRSAAEGFSERTFYLREFRGRSLAIALPDGPISAPGLVRDVLESFARNETHAVLVGSDRRALAELGVAEPVEAADPDWLAGLRRAQRLGLGLGLCVHDGGDRLAACGRVAERLRLAKLVWLDESAPLEREGRGVVTFVGRGDLDGWLAEASGSPRGAFLRSVARMIDDGLPSVAVTRSDALSEELFTFSGAGTLFARERYVDVRWLGLDEFDAAAELLRRGVEEGYLVRRSDEELERVLASAFGVFVEGRYLAGIASLLPHPGSRMVELASLYTLTRFVGEGVGGHLLRFAVERARAGGMEAVFACTTQERVVRFFERHGFGRVGHDVVPEGKWKGYAEERRGSVHCLLRNVA